jgi:hypothetical protein
MKEAIIPMAKAFPAFPFLVIGYPSKQVATAEGDPGIPSSTEPMKAPEQPPIQRLRRKMIADPDSMVYVNGMKRMTANVPLSPGMTR